jgi:hypothetical protein
LLTDDITCSAAWVHGFRNSIQGNVAEETGAFSKFDTQYASIVLGLKVQFRGKRRATGVPTQAPSEPVTLAEH